MTSDHTLSSGSQEIGSDFDESEVFESFEITTGADSISVAVTSDIVEFLELYIDEEETPRRTVLEPPYEATLNFSELDAGARTLRAIVGVRFMGRISPVVRYETFEVSGEPEAEQPPESPSPGDPAPEVPAPVEPPAPSCDQVGSNTFFGCYYTGMAFNQLVFTQNDTQINFNYGRGAPDPRLPEDGFSIRWKGEFTFEGGLYEFKATADDGVRLFVNGQRVINQWQNQAATAFTTSVDLSQGKHTIELHYYEDQFNASVALEWRKVEASVPAPSPVPMPDPEPAPAPTPTPSPAPTQRLQFQEDMNSDFLNPERGWMDRGTGSRLANARLPKTSSDDHPIGYTVVWTEPFGTPFNGTSGNPFRLDNYRTQNLPSALLQAVDREFQAARTAGVKMKVRFSYNYSDQDTNVDTSLSWMQAHIRQLAPVLNANRDTIASMDAGFLGKWGEWHGSSHLVNSTNPWWQEPWISARRSLMNTLLQEIHPDIMIGMRQPRQDNGIRAQFGSAWRMDLNERFTGTPQSRVGWYNDCIFTDQSNVGTFDFDHSLARGNLDRETNAWVGQYAATSGESCEAGGVTPYGEAVNAINEMEYMGGPDTLFRRYWPGTYERWRNSGHYAEISRRLGYRLSLVSMTLPSETRASADMTIEMTIKNSGFGKVYNRRPMELVFVGGGETFTAVVTPDARRDLPLGGQTVTSLFRFQAPSGLKDGQAYDVFLRLPDPSARLSNDVRYSLRLANSGNMWNPSNGRHDLKARIVAK